GLDASDVVVEVGPGLGVLTRRLAERTSYVHAIELDRSLEPHLPDARVRHSNVAFIWDDALDVAIADLRPEPNKLVANLPYSVATPLVVETLEHAPSLPIWRGVGQRE